MAFLRLRSLRGLLDNPLLAADTPAGLFFLLLACLIAVPGCQSARPIPYLQTDAALFGPVQMRLHPIFTQIKDWTGDGNPTGIEAQLEFQDQFGEPCKAAGKVIFHLYNYLEQDPDHRGDLLLNPWVAYLTTIEDQRLRWDRTSRTYKFQLRAPGISLHHSYLLEAMFEHPSDNGVRRLFAQWIYKAPLETIKGSQPEIPPMPSTMPTSGPATEPATASAGGEPTTRSSRHSPSNTTQPARHHGAAAQ